MNNEIYRVVYNDRYGGFDLSKEALKQYNLKSLKNIEYADYIERDDPVLIELVETMGEDVNSYYSKLKIMEFPYKFKDFLNWNEYDGKEYMSINYDKYLIQMIQKVRQQEISPQDKIALINDLFIEYESRPKSYFEKLKENKNID